MNEVPPQDAFEPRPEDASDGGRIRRRLQIAVTLILVAALVVLAAVEGSGFIIRGGDPTPSPKLPAPRLAIVDAARGLVSVDTDGGPAVAFSQPGVTFRFPTGISRALATGEIGFWSH